MRHLIRKCLYSFTTNQKPKNIDEIFDKPKFSRLNNRGLIVVAGQQTRKFLQGLITNNIEELYQGDKNSINDKKVAIYSLFLGPKGKIITDAIIFRPIVFANGKKQRVENQLWIDVSMDMNNILSQHLRKYTWKKKVEVNSIAYYQDEGPQLHAGFAATVQDLSQNKDKNQINRQAGKIVDTQESIQAQGQEDGTYANICFLDPRSPRLGVRIICDKQGFRYKNAKQQASISQYQRQCMINGITSSTVMKNKLPFMFNSDLFNGFSFKKGCYLGQELVARAYHTGIVRRRVFPFALRNQKQKLEVGTIIYDENKNQLGKILQSSEGIGTILSSYLPLMQKSWPIQFSSPEAGFLLCPFANQLHQYLNNMKQKQAKLQQIDL